MSIFRRAAVRRASCTDLHTHFTTLVGWVTLIKGLSFLFLSPEVETELYLRQLHYEQFFYMYAAISLVLGVYLTYGGFLSKSQ